MPNGFSLGIICYAPLKALSLCDTMMYINNAARHSLRLYGGGMCRERDHCHADQRLCKRTDPRSQLRHRPGCGRRHGQVHERRALSLWQGRAGTIAGELPHRKGGAVAIHRTPACVVFLDISQEPTSPGATFKAVISAVDAYEEDICAKAWSGIPVRPDQYLTPVLSIFSTILFIREYVLHQMLSR